MLRFANELLDETPMSVSSTTAQLVASNELVSSVVVSVSSALGLAMIGVLISPGCGQPT